MSSNTETEVEARIINMIAIALLVLAVFMAVLETYGPNYRALKRIEANQQPCQGK